jgi:hypothetical protein
LAGELERPDYCGERRGCFLAAVSAVVFWVSKIGSSPTSRLQRTAQAGFLLGWGQFGVGLARENVVKLGQLLPVKWCWGWGCFWATSARAATETGRWAADKTDTKLL